MSKEKNNNASWWKSATKVVGLNPVTFEEKWSIQWTSYQVVSAVLILLSLLFVLFYLALTKTPLYQILPKEVTTQSQQELFELYSQVEDHSSLIEAQDKYIRNLQLVLLGEVSIDSIFSEQKDLDGFKFANLDTTQKTAELKLEEEIQQRKENSSKAKKSFSEFYLVDPVQGKVSQKFNAENHPAIDIVTVKDEPILACLEGVVIHSAYNDKDGWVIMIKHPTDITSVYKHCSKVLKEIGDFVSAGDAIGIVGNTGTNTTGPHLHFELWSSNGPINPLDYLSFYSNK